MELVSAYEAHQMLRDASRTDQYGTVIALSRLLAKLQPELYRDAE
jgi:hypothetical protein